MTMYTTHVLFEQVHVFVILHVAVDSGNDLRLQDASQKNACSVQATIATERDYLCGWQGWLLPEPASAPQEFCSGNPKNPKNKR